MALTNKPQVKTAALPSSVLVNGTGRSRQERVTLEINQGKRFPVTAHCYEFKSGVGDKLDWKYVLDFELPDKRLVSLALLEGRFDDDPSVVSVITENVVIYEGDEHRVLGCTFKALPKCKLVAFEGNYVQIYREQENITGVVTKKCRTLIKDKRKLGKTRTTDTAEPSKDLSTTEQLSPIFAGSLDRDAMAAALKAVMSKDNLSVRSAATEANTSPTVIQRVKDGSATIDTSLEVLENLGYPVAMSVPPKAP